MMSPKYKELIDNLTEKTSEGKIKWERTSQKCRFQVTIGDQIVFVYSAADEPPTFWTFDVGAPKAEFVIRGVNGEESDSLKAYSRTDLLYSELQPLYQAAKSSATEIDKKIDGLLTSLDKL